MLAFGPVPSRRLGRSLGVNNIPPKVCTYSCAYCQLGRTHTMQIERQTFYQPQEIIEAVQTKVQMAQSAGEAIDYLTFVADGEPTLDLNLGQEIKQLKSLGIKVAVITNGSLIWREDVRAELQEADWVSLKVDAVQEKIWHQVDRPHRGLTLEAILKGMLEFSKTFKGELATETMLIENTNDSQEHIREIATFLAQLNPDIAYLSIPTRPPAEEWAHAPSEAVINHAYQILDKDVEHVEYLIGYEGEAFALTGNAEEDLLSITAVHPMRKEAVETFLKKAGTGWTVIDTLIAQGKLIEVEHEQNIFYMRKFS